MLNTLYIEQEYEQVEYYRSLYGRNTLIVGGLAAGFGAPVDEEFPTETIYLQKSPDYDSNHLVFTVNGDSMEPDYPHGAKVCVQRMNPSDIPYGTCVACIAAGTPYIKIYERDGLHSTNPAYKTIRVSDDDECRIWGRVVRVIPDEEIAPRKIADLLGKYEEDEEE